MTSLFYLIWKSVKNGLKELLKKPGKLALYALVVLLLGGAIVLSLVNKPTIDETSPMFIFRGILFVFTALFVVIAVIKGISKGDTIFEMNDVNLLFVSPVSPRKILLYGVLRLTKISFFAGFFILFQGNTLAQFGVAYSGVWLTLLGFMLAVMTLSIVSLILYNLTNSRPRRKLIAKILTALLFVPFALRVLVGMAGGDMFTALQAAIQSPFLSLVPVAGWTAAGITDILSGEMMSGLLFLGLNLLLGAGLVTYLLLSKTDYYEDTLVATETAFEKKRAVAEGDMNAAQLSTRKIKVTKTGIGGSGAAALFGKHLRESFRENRFGFITFTSMIIVVAAIGMLYFVKDTLLVLQILMWMQIFMIGTGRGLKESYSHYIYMLPESSFKKILWSNMETMIKVLLESLLIFGVGGILAGANPLIAVGAITAYTMFSLLLIGVDYLSMRFTGANLSMGLLITIYYLAVIVIMAPGLIAAMMIGISVGGVSGNLLGLGILSVWELAAGLSCFALARGVLHNCDMPSVKMKG